jgi:hypothetical protein
MTDVINNPEILNINQNNQNQIHTGNINSNLNKKLEENSCCCSEKRIWIKNAFMIYITLIYILAPVILTDIFIIYRFSKTYKKIIFYILIHITLIYILICLFNVATTKPGYQEKNFALTQEEFNQINPKIKIDNEFYPLKYCYTCNIIREARTFHCNQCKRCIKKHDHHCPFVNNCIGKENYWKFFKFLVSVLVFSIIILIINIIFIVDEGLKGSIIKIVINFGIIIAAICTILSMISFIIQHIYYVSNNLTTREIIKDNMKKELVDKGCKNNWKNSLNDNYKDEFDIKYEELIEQLKNQRQNVNNV